MPIIDDDLLNDLKHLIGKDNQGYVFYYGSNQSLTKRAVNKIVAKAVRQALPIPTQPEKTLILTFSDIQFPDT